MPPYVKSSQQICITLLTNTGQQLFILFELFQALYATQR